MEMRLGTSDYQFIALVKVIFNEGNVLFLC